MCHLNDLIWSCGCIIARNFSPCEASKNNLPCNLERLVNAVSIDCPLHPTINPQDLQMPEGPDVDLDKLINELEERLREKSAVEKEDESKEVERLWREFKGHSMAEGFLRQRLAARSREVEAEANAEATTGKAQLPNPRNSFFEREEEVLEEGEVVEEKQLPPPMKRKAGRPSSKHSGVNGTGGQNKAEPKRPVRGWAYVDEDEIKPTEAEIFEQIARQNLA